MTARDVAIPGVAQTCSGVHNLGPHAALEQDRQQNNLSLGGFFRIFHDNGPWPLLAIRKVTGDIQAADITGDAAREANAHAWAGKWNEAGYDVYFGVNPLKAPMARKARKEDVLEARWMWADCDPPGGSSGSDLEAWRADKLAEIRAGREDVRPPTIIIDSGRGFWAFWRLRKPEPVDGRGPQTVRVESFGRGIAEAFDADNCQNIERIARLPGYVNHKTGRTARVVEYHAERDCDLSDLPSAPLRPHEGSGSEAIAEEFSEFVDDDAAKAAVRRHLAKSAPLAVEGQGGRATTMRVLQKCQDFGCSFEISVELMEEFWNSRCLPPWEPDDIEETFRGLRRNDPIGCEHPEVVKRNKSALAAKEFELLTRPADQGEPASGGALDSIDLDARPPAFTDEALALQFAQIHEGDLRFVAAWGKWLRWTGTHWQSDDTLHAFDRARHTCRAAAAACNDPKVASAIASAKTVAAVERLAKADRRLAATVDQWDPDHWLINTPSGVLDLRTGKMGPHSAVLYMTKMTAVGRSGECPRFRAFLETVTDGDLELQDYLGRVLGYGLTGLTREHALFFAHGSGANGKSVLLSTVAGIMDSYHRAAPVETFTASSGDRHPTDLAMLRGARLVTAVETEEGRRWAESRIKQLTGGDAVTARFMRQDFFEYTPAFKLILAGNHKPSLRSVDESIRRRFHLIPFAVTIPPEARDPELTEKLKYEWPGILAWMVDGCLRWQERGLDPPKAVQDATAAYLEAEDAFSAWFEDKCERDPKGWETSADLFASWKRWAEAAGENPGQMKRFAQQLELHGVAPARRMAARGFAGIRWIRNENEQWAER